MSPERRSGFDRVRWNLEPVDESRDHQVSVVVMLVNDLIDLSNDFSNKRGTLEKQHIVRFQDAINMKADTLLCYLLDYFHGAVTEVDVRNIFELSENFGAMDSQTLSQIPGKLLPVLVMRVLLHRHLLPMNPGECVNWERFMDRYGAAISAA